MNSLSVEKKQNKMLIVLICIIQVILAFLSGFAAANHNNGLSISSPTLTALLIYFQYALAFASILITVLFFKVKIDLILVALIIYWLMYVLNSYGAINLNALTMVMLVSFAILPNLIKVKIFRFLKYLMIFIAIAGIICYVSYEFELGLPYTKVQYYFGNGTLSYIDYKFIFLYQINNTEYLRLCGIFNEPGYYGTILVLLLIGDSFNLKKFYTWIFLIAGFLTFSFAFFVTIFIYILFKSYKNKNALISIILITLFILFVIPNIKTNNDNINHLLERFNIVEFLTSSDERTNQKLDSFFEQFLNTNDIFFGLGRGYANSISTGALSYKEYIIDYGILGCIILYGSLLIASLKSANKNFTSIILIICFFVNIYQRPSIYTSMYFAILFGGIIYLNYKKDKLVN